MNAQQMVPIAPACNLQELMVTLIPCKPEVLVNYSNRRVDTDVKIHVF